jgi:hypothetical protein
MLSVLTLSRVLSAASPRKKEHVPCRTGWKASAAGASKRWRKKSNRNCLIEKVQSDQRTESASPSTLC